MSVHAGRDDSPLFIDEMKRVRNPDLTDYPHTFVLVDDAGLSAACTCGWFDEQRLLDENNARAMHAHHLATV